MLNYFKNNFASFVLILGIFVFQFYLFHQYLLHEIIGYYPANHDQASYLPFTYELFEDIKQGTWLFALNKMIHTLYTGVIFPLYALIVFTVIGPSRFAALVPNLLIFFSLQLILFLTVNAISKKKSLALFSVGLLLCCNTPFLVGGIADYRMDFLGFCLYGIFICLILRSENFTRSGYILSAAIIAAVMALTRFITLLYIMPLILAGFCYLIIYKKKLLPYTVSCLLFFLLLSPSIILNYDNLYQYYIVGHVTGGEAVLRGLPPGTTLLQGLLYYPKNILSTHMGPLGLWVGSFALLFFFIRFLDKKNSSSTQLITSKFNCIFLLLSLFIPIILLTLDSSKSIVVGSIAVTPLILLFTLLCMFLEKSWHMDNKISSIFSLAVILAALIHQSYYYHKHISHQHRIDLNTISNMYIDIGNYAVNHHWNDILFSTDQIKDSIYFGCLNTLYYEKYGKLISVHRELLGANLLALSEKEALESIARTNVAILTMDNYPDEWPPFQRAFATYRFKIIDYAEKHFHVLGDYTFQNNHYRVYVAT